MVRIMVSKTIDVGSTPAVDRFEWIQGVATAGWLAWGGVVIAIQGRVMFNLTSYFTNISCMMYKMWDYITFESSVSFFFLFNKAV